MHRVLILGSSGQIGGHLVTYLRTRGYEVFEYDIVRSGTEDLRNIPSAKFESLISESDFIFFLAFDAGGSHYLASYQDTFQFIENNLKILIYTMQVFRKYEKPFLFASSQMSNMNQSTYGLLKAIGERYTHSIGGKVVKFWNVYGHEKDEAKFHVISDFIKMAKETSVIQMKTNGLETRDFLYADDCCVGLETLMLKFYEIPINQNLHLANFEWNTILEVGQIIAELLNSKVVPGTQSDGVQLNLKNEPDRYTLNFWKPQTTLREGIKKVIYLDNIS